jgi:3-hydroxyisobutyrate dehydrogenase-like beta-hydroxyacid dehydrogenase
MSTISVALSDHLTEAHSKAGQSYVAAPVFGRPAAAVAVKLFHHRRRR